MKKLLFLHNGVGYYSNGHSNHRMKVRKIAPEDVQKVIEHPTKETAQGYANLVEGVSEGCRIKVFYRQKAKHVEILTAIKMSFNKKKEEI